jgi:hypothetical protein
MNGIENEIPRRNQINRWTAAERAIAAAVEEVERAGADVRLTDAVVLLGEARQSVADYVDGVAGPRRGVLYFEDRGQDAKASGLVCPFCRDDDFDAVGLKHHLTHGNCQAFERVESLGLQIGGQV